jgi:hypothetical protein
MRERPLPNARPVRQQLAHPLWAFGKDLIRVLGRIDHHAKDCHNIGVAKLLVEEIAH